MQDFIKNNWFKLIVVIVLLAVGSSAIYYYLVSKPAQDEAALQQSTSAQDQAAAQTTSQAQQLQSCLDGAKQTFVASAAQLCQQLESEMNNYNIQCSPYPYPAAPNYLTIVKQESDAEALCATLYK